MFVDDHLKWVERKGLDPWKPSFVEDEVLLSLKPKQKSSSPKISRDEEKKLEKEAKTKAHLATKYNFTDFNIANGFGDYEAAQKKKKEEEAAQKKNKEEALKKTRTMMVKEDENMNDYGAAASTELPDYM